MRSHAPKIRPLACLNTEKFTINQTVISGHALCTTGWPKSKFEICFGYNSENMHFWPYVGKAQFQSYSQNKFQILIWVTLYWTPPKTWVKTPKNIKRTWLFMLEFQFDYRQISKFRAFYTFQIIHKMTYKWHTMFSHS